MNDLEPELAAIADDAEAEDVDERQLEAAHRRLLAEIAADPKGRSALSSYILPMLGYPIPDREQVAALIACNRDAGKAERERREARDLLVYGNIRLVLHFAFRHLNRGLGLLDLVQEGVVGLMKAVAKYDSDHVKKAKLSTYAAWWIRQAMSRAIDNMSSDMPFRMPVHVLQARSAVNRAVQAFEAEHGRTPDDDPEALLGTKRDHERMHVAFWRLPRSQRLALRLRLDGDGFPAIAETLGIPVNTAKSRVRYALEKIREELADPDDPPDALHMPDAA
jgi:RNA polymerase sigma factor (sigma-70 family)